ncbi:response regulator transcription factor [Amygdalobacter indicium]|uniref:response regulator transcription factor n=1 Tax=Amygdalobacter indicium TaxID=3029272 RepID=UPI00279B546E|nr:response regulator transcription factor [Amygdalobacter indicium]WEG34754.1 response regulator transcription factor [Amygdalobacter indicium]
MQTTILICDDDPIVHESLRLYLTKEGMRLRSAFNGEDGLNIVKKEKPDLVLADVMMPQMTGLELCREIRKFSQVPIMMLTARGEEIDRILGLELGADDYIVKPFSPRELIARIKAVLRRTENHNQTETDSDATDNKKNKLINIGSLHLDLDRYTADYAGTPIEFTKKELDLLSFLCLHPNETFTREKLLEKVWGYEFGGQTRTVDTHIKQIRRKLSEFKVLFNLMTVHGIGYRIDMDKELQQ